MEFKSLHKLYILLFLKINGLKGDYFFLSIFTVRMKTNAPNTKFRSRDFTIFPVGIYRCPSSVTGGCKLSAIV